MIDHDIVPVLKSVLELFYLTSIICVFLNHVIICIKETKYANYVTMVKIIKCMHNMRLNSNYSRL